MSDRIGTTSPELITLYLGLPPENPGAFRSRAFAIIGARFPSFTVTDSTGVFRGEQELMLRIEIATTVPQEVADCAAILRRELNQEGVGVAFRGHYLRVTKDAPVRL